MTKLNRFCSAIIESIWLLVLILVPIFINPWVLHSFTLAKDTLFVSLTVIMALAWLVKFSDQKISPLFIALPKKSKSNLSSKVGQNSNQKNETQKEIWEKWLFIAVASLLVVYLFSSFFALVPAAAWFGFPARSLGSIALISLVVFFTLTATELKTQKQLNRLVKTSILTGAFVSLYALLQHFGLDIFAITSAEYASSGRVMGGTTGNPVALGAYLILTLLLTGGYIIKVIKTERKWYFQKNFYFSIIFAGLQLAACLFTKSRGPVLGLLAGGMFFFLVWAWFTKQKKVLGGGLLVLALGAILFTVFFAPFSPLQIQSNSSDIARLKELFDPSAGNGSWRAGIWQVVTKTLNNAATPLVNAYGNADTLGFARLLIGYGAENLFIPVNQFFSPGLPTGGFDRTHNYVLDLMLHFGIIGTLVFFGFWFLLFWIGEKKIGLIQKRSDTYTFLGCLLGAGIGLSLGSSLFLGWNFWGLGLQVGIVGGVLLFPLFKTFMKNTEVRKETDFTADLALLTVVLSVFVAHLVETAFSFPVIESEVIVWTAAALIVLLSRTTSFFGAVSSVENNNEADFASENESVLVLGGIVATIISTFSFVMFNLNAWIKNDLLASWLKALTAMPDGSRTWLYPVFLVLFLLGGIGFLLERTDFRSLLLGGKAFIIAFVTVVGISILNAWYLAYTPTYTGIEKSWEWVSYYENWAIFVLLVEIFFVAMLSFGINKSGIKDSSPIKTTNYWLSWLTAGILLIVALFVLENVDLARNKAEIVGLREQFFTKTEEKIVMQVRVANHVNYQSDNFGSLANSYLSLLDDSTIKTDSKPEFAQNAEKYALKAVSINPYDVYPVYLLGRVKMYQASIYTKAEEQAKYGQNALTYFETAARLSPMNGEMLYAKLYAQEKVLNDTTGLEAGLKQVIKLAPNYPDAYDLLAIFYENEGRKLVKDEAAQKYVDLAITNYKLAFEKSKTNTAFFDHLISLCKLKNYSTEAILKLHQEALLVADDSVKYRILIRIANIYYDDGQKELALKYAKESLAIAPAEVQADFKDLIRTKFEYTK